MTEARHQLLEAGARGGGEHAAYVAEIMKLKPRQPGFTQAAFQTGRKLDRRSAAPLAPTKTRPCSPASANRSKCQASSGVNSAGKLSVRRPARGKDSAPVRKLGDEQDRAGPVSD